MLTLLLAAALAIPPAAGTPTGTAPMTMLPAMPTLPAADRPGPDEQTGAVKFARALQETTSEAKIKGLDDSLLALLRPTPFRGLVVCTRAEALIRSTAASRTVSPDVSSAADECYQLRPADARAIALAAGVAVGRKDSIRAAQLMLALIKADPARGIDVRFDVLESTLRNLAYAGQRRLATDLTSALLRAGYSAGGARWSAGAATVTVRNLVVAGEPREAVALLPRVTAPAEGLGLLIDRRVAPIWEDMAAWAAGGLVTQRDALVRAEQAAFDAEPTIRNRLRLSSTLVAAGRLRAGMALLRAGYDAPAAFASPEQADDAIDLSVRLAGLLAKTGQPDAAAIVLRGAQARLGTIKASHALGLSPNLAMMLIASKRFDEARQILATARPPVDGVFNPAMLAFYDSIGICADARSGQKERARATLAQLRQTYPNNLQALSMAETCTGDIAARRAAILAAFDDPERRTGALVEWLRTDATPQYNYILGNPAMDTALRHDPALIAAYEKYARPLPPQYADALAEWPDAESAAP